MLTTIRDAMIAVLEDLSLFKQVDVWKGDLADLQLQAKSLPSAYVLLHSGAFAPRITLPPAGARLHMSWDVIVFFGGLGSSAAATDAGYALIETVCSQSSTGGLTGLKTAGGQLWPTDLELMGAQNGVIVYRIGFVIEDGIPDLPPT
jgi:hypothetical protein